MSELIELHQPGDSVYTITDYGKVHRWIVTDSGNLREEKNLWPDE